MLEKEISKDTHDSFLENDLDIIEYSENKYNSSSQIKFEDNSYDVMEIEFDDPLILLSYVMENPISAHYSDKFEDFCYETSIKQEMAEIDIDKVKTENPNYSCDQCDIKSNLKKHIKEHIRSIHERYYFTSTYCCYTFRGEECLNTHMKRTHNQAYECETCEITFSSKYSYMKHVKRDHHN